MGARGAPEGAPSLSINSTPRPGTELVCRRLSVIGLFSEGRWWRQSAFAGVPVVFPVYRNSMGRGSLASILPRGERMTAAGENSLDFSEQSAAALARELYRIEARVKELPSERDQNFQLWDGSGAEFVLKIGNPAESID